MAVSFGLPRQPQPRPVNDWRAAEDNAVEWLRWLGHPDAHLTPVGPDGGIDILARHAFAQVKWQGKPVGAPALQQLFGARGGRDGGLYFFSNAGYTKQALEYAEQNHIAAFTYSVATGVIEAVTAQAHRHDDATEQRQRKAEREVRKAEQQARQRAEHAVRVSSAIRELGAARAKSHQYRRFGILLLLATPVWWVVATIVTDAPSLWRGTPGVVMLFAGLVALRTAGQWDKAIREAAWSRASQDQRKATANGASPVPEEGKGGLTVEEGPLP